MNGQKMPVLGLLGAEHLLSGSAAPPAISCGGKKLRSACRKGCPMKAATLALALLSIASSAQASPDAAPEGFVSLFNGKDLSGWNIPVGDNGHWKVVDGVIDYDAQSEAKGDKHLMTEKSYGDFILQVDWRIKETPFINPNVPYILPDGTHARDIHGKVMRMALPDSDSGIILRGNLKNQVNIWCWPIGSGEFYGYRTDKNMPPEVKAGVTPKTQADNPVGEWNRYIITVKGDRVSVELNGKLVIDKAQLPGIAKEGPIGFQHHGQMMDGKWAASPSLMQFRNVFIKKLNP